MDKIKVVISVVCLVVGGVSGYAVGGRSAATAADVQFQQYKQEISAKDEKIKTLESDVASIRKMMEEDRATKKKANDNLKKALEAGKNEKGTGKSFKGTYKW